MVKAITRVSVSVRMAKVKCLAVGEEVTEGEAMKVRAATHSVSMVRGRARRSIVNRVEEMNGVAVGHSSFRLMAVIMSRLAGSGAHGCVGAVNRNSNGRDSFNILMVLMR